MNALDCMLIAILCFIAHLVFISPETDSLPVFISPKTDSLYKFYGFLAENDTFTIDILPNISTVNHTSTITYHIINTLHYAMIYRETIYHEMMDGDQISKWHTHVKTMIKPAHFQKLKLFCVDTNQTLTCKWH